MAFLSGLAAGAAGTAALNVVTYMDMAVRGRASSEMPAKVAGQLAEEAELEPLTGETDEADNRRQASGAMLGYITGLGIGAAYGLLRRKVTPPVGLAGVALGLGAMVAADAPATALKLTDPREWSAKAWASDIVPHLVYGLVTATAYEGFSKR